MWFCFSLQRCLNLLKNFIIMKFDSNKQGEFPNSQPPASLSYRSDYCYRFSKVKVGWGYSFKFSFWPIQAYLALTNIKQPRQKGWRQLNNNRHVCVCVCVSERFCVCVWVGVRRSKAQVLEKGILLNLITEAMTHVTDSWCTLSTIHMHNITLWVWKAGTKGHNQVVGSVKA